jgi:hypothetical protein
MAGAAIASAALVAEAIAAGAAERPFVELQAAVEHAPAALLMPK